MNDTDRKDIKLALNQMSSGIGKLLEFAKSSTAASQKLDDQVHKLTGSVQLKKLTVGKRIEIANVCFKHGIPTGAIGGGVIAGGSIAADAFGGMGVLIVSGTAVSPVGAVIGASILGGAAAATVTTLVKKFWFRHQLKALGYLERIFEELNDLNSANKHFMQYMRDAEEKAHCVSQHMQDIELCLESERQRRMNRDICQRGIESTTAVIKSLKQIADMDISKWVQSQTLTILSNPGSQLLSITN